MELIIPRGVEDEALYRSRMQRFVNDVSVYPVSCERLAQGRSDLQWLEAVLAGGARIVQLRDKFSSSNVLYEKALRFRELTSETGALFIVNDRVDIAVRARADGVHVGQGDLAPAEVRRQAPDLIIGYSCNTYDQVRALGEEVLDGRSSVSYYNIGPLYPTQTKEGLKHFLGAEAVSLYSAACPLPFTVMGGIKFHHIKELVGAGAKRIAVVTALSLADDIAAETGRWVEHMRSLQGAAE